MQLYNDRDIYGVWRNTKLLPSMAVVKDQVKDNFGFRTK